MTKQRMNVLTVGSKSYEKSSFIRSILKGYGNDEEPVRSFSLLNTSYNVSSNEASEQSVCLVEVERCQVLIESNVMELVIYDFPGYEDSTRNNQSVDIIRDNLLDRHEKWRDIQVYIMF